MTISYEDYIKKRSENEEYYETEKLIKNYLSEQEQKKRRRRKRKKILGSLLVRLKMAMTSEI